MGKKAATPTSSEKSPPKKKRERTEMCIHRLRPDQHCSRCDP